MSRPAERVPVEVGGRRLTLSNLDKVLYPQTGFTKAEVIDYYSRVGPTLLPYLAGRPLTVIRFPDGVGGKSFFEKNAPRHRPPWLRTVRLPSPGSGRGHEQIDYALLDDLAGLVWAANLAALELHVPMWRVDGAGRPQPPDLLVFDLDPGPPATVVDCCRVALALRAELAADGLTGHPKTSGSKGLQLYVPVSDVPSWRATHGYARQLAERLTAAMPELVVAAMTKSIRAGRVLIDWSQNNAAKTTVAVYSLRAREAPTVSTPVTWDEVAAAAKGSEPLRFTADAVLARLARYGDLFAPTLAAGAPLPETEDG